MPTFWAKVENEFVGVEAVDVREAVKRLSELVRFWSLIA